MAKHYAGVGQRNITLQVAETMKQCASKLEAMGYILRSGGARGSDSAFESGVSNPSAKLIYRPWNDGKGIPLSKEDFIYSYNLLKELNIIPWIDNIDQVALKLHCRNVFQITNQQKHNVNFVLYYCDRGSGLDTQGGTRTAIVLAYKLGIKTYNLYEPKVLQKVENFIE